MISWLRRQFAEHPVRAATLVYVLFTLAICNVKLFAPEGPWWRGWGDQKAYLASAQAFGGFDLDPANHWYPLLYPLLGAPFAGVSPVPFLPANIACFAFACWGFSRVCARFEVPAAGAAFLFLATTLAPGIGVLWVEPWSTTLSAALIWLAFALAADLNAGEGDRAGAARLGAVLTLVAAARPADLTIAAAILTFALWPLIRGRRFGLLLPLLAGGIGAGAAYALLYLAVHGPRLSDYVLLSQAYGTNPADLGFKAYVLLIEPRAWFGTGAGLLQAMPWLILGAAGLILALRRGPLAWCLLAAALANLVTMLVYVDLLPTGLWRFHNVHYFKWMFPLFGLGALLFVRVARTRWKPAATVLAVLLLLSGFRYDGVRAPDDAPARAILFASPEAGDTLYMASSAIADAGGALRNKFEYRQLGYRPNRVLAIAVRRPFAGREQWWLSPPPDMVEWPVDRGSPQPLAKAEPQAPVARYRAALRYGWPCWLPPWGCAQTFAE